MKKDLIFAPIMLVIGALLFLHDLVGLGAHIAVAVIGVFVLAVYTSLTKKEWKIPALELAMRALYGLALISGIVVMNVKGINALNLVHIITAILFVASLALLFVVKLVSKKESK